MDRRISGRALVCGRGHTDVGTGGGWILVDAPGIGDGGVWGSKANPEAQTEDELKMVRRFLSWRIVSMNR